MGGCSSHRYVFFSRNPGRVHFGNQSTRKNFFTKFGVYKTLVSLHDFSQQKNIPPFHPKEGTTYYTHGIITIHMKNGSSKSLNQPKTMGMFPFGSTLPETNSSPLKMGRPLEKVWRFTELGVSTIFRGENVMLVFRECTPPSTFNGTSRPYLPSRRFAPGVYQIMVGPGC